MQYYFSVIAVLLTAFSVTATPTSTVILRHHGAMTMYEPESLSDAFNDAVDGDTLLLSKGTFPSFTLDKCITVRGEGQETHINGDIKINLKDSVLTNTALEGLHFGNVDSYGDYFDRDITINNSSVNLAIRQCRFSTITFTELSKSRGHDNVCIDRCHVSGYFKFGASVRSMIVKNCYIHELWPTAETKKPVSFINCNIALSYYNWHSYISDFRGSFINCIVGGGSNQEPLRHVSIFNTLLAKYPVENTSCMTDHVYIENSEVFLENYYPIRPCKYSDEQLIEKGYIGNDGTQVGYTGGATPFTLKLNVPEVESSILLYDPSTRTLNIDITLTPSR